MKALRYIIITAISIVALAVQGKEQRNNILVLNSYTNYIWSNYVTDAVLENYVKQRPTTQLDIETLNLPLHQDIETIHNITKGILDKYEDKKPSTIIVLGNPAFLAFSNILQNEWDGVPVIWCSDYEYTATLDDILEKNVSDSIPKRYVEGLTAGTNTVIVHCPVYIKENVELMLRMKPELKRIAFFSDSRYVNAQIRTSLQNFMHANYPEISLQFYTDGEVNFEETLDSIRYFDNTTGLLFCSWLRTNDMLGDKYFEANSYKMLAAASPQPLFSLNDTGVHSNELAGGYFYCGEDLGMKVVGLLEELEKNGGDAKKLESIDAGTPQYVLSHDLLAKGGISPELFPQNAKILFAPPTFYERNRVAIIMLCVFSAIVIILITLLMIMRKRRKRQAREIELMRDYKTTLDNMPVFYIKQKIIFNEKKEAVDYMLIDANKLYLDAAEYKKAPIGSKGSEIDPKKYQYYLNIYKNVNETKNPHIVEAQNPNNGHYYEINMLPYKNDGTVEVFGLDVTNRKIMELDLLESKDKAEKSNRLKSAFLANMSHEIRTPLNAVVGFSNLLASEGEEPENRQEYMKIIESNNKQLLHLIDDILDLSKIESGTLEFVYRDFDLNNMMREIEQVFIQNVEDKPIEIICKPGLPQCTIMSEQNRLTQLLTNIMNNAVKFTEKGSITFGYRVEEEKKQLYFYVEDTGCGIPEDKKSDIFERFVKLNQFIPGTGLGLSICDMLVHKLGGEIGVESELGKGSTFWFTIPYTPTTATPGTNKTVKGFTAKPNGKYSILIAEDNVSNFMLFNSILKKDYDILHAINGEEAVKMFHAHKPDIIIMDINMPVMNGYEAVAEIRKISKTIPIIAVTAYAYEYDEYKIMHSGFNAYISKPVNLYILKKKILSLLE